MLDSRERYQERGKRLTIVNGLNPGVSVVRVV